MRVRVQVERSGQWWTIVDVSGEGGDPDGGYVTLLDERGGRTGIPVDMFARIEGAAPALAAFHAAKEAGIA